MNHKPKVIVLRAAGTNCDQETAFAFKSCGALVDLVHVNQLIKRQVELRHYHILAIPGGFTYGDDIESGRILANEIRLHLGEEIPKFVEEGKLIIGICNGFQVLVKAGFLPGQLATETRDRLRQSVSLITNDSGKFEDRWTYLKVDGKSPWIKGLQKIVFFPVAHGEGKFVAENEEVLRQLKENGQIAFRYVSKGGEQADYPANPNGSVFDIAGITDKTGRVLGLMPHPERHFLFTQHPFWPRLGGRKQFGDGARIFENGINYIKENVLKETTIEKKI